MPTVTEPPQPITPGMPTLTWNKTYGEKGQDIAHAIIKVNDGYIIAGDLGNDIGLIKTDLNGNQQWRKTYGAEGIDSARTVIEVSDGYIVAGSSTSYEGFGISGIYLMKTDPRGDRLWYKTFSYTRNGLLTNAYGSSAIAVDDGYVIVGSANADINGGSDIYLIKTDLNGNLVWNKTFGGDAADHGSAIIQVRDGYIIAGDSSSYGNDASDIYLIKTDSYGNLVWNKTFGGKDQEVANALIATDDGYIVVGSTKSYSNFGKYDVYVVKTDLQGSQEWSNHYGAADDDQGRSIVPVGDGYVITGYTSSIGNFYKDIYLLKIDKEGSLVWNRTYGGADMDEGNCIIKVGEGFAIAGYSCTYGVYTSDYCVYKIDPAPKPTPKTTAMPSQAATAAPTAQAGGLSTLDIGILVVVTIAVIGVAGGMLFMLYFRPKK